MILKDPVIKTLRFSASRYHWERWDFKRWGPRTGLEATDTCHCKTCLMSSLSYPFLPGKEVGLQHGETEPSWTETLKPWAKNTTFPLCAGIVLSTRGNQTAAGHSLSSRQAGKRSTLFICMFACEHANFWTTSSTCIRVNLNYLEFLLLAIIHKKQNKVLIH